MALGSEYETRNCPSSFRDIGSPMFFVCLLLRGGGQGACVVWLRTGSGSSSGVQGVQG